MDFRKNKPSSWGTPIPGTPQFSFSVSSPTPSPVTTATAHLQALRKDLLHQFTQLRILPEDVLKLFRRTDLDPETSKRQSAGRVFFEYVE